MNTARTILRSLDVGLLLAVAATLFGKITPEQLGVMGGGMALYVGGLYVWERGQSVIAQPLPLISMILILVVTALAAALIYIR